MDKILVINLNKDKEKRQLLEDQFKKLDITNYEFYPAFYGKNILNRMSIQINKGYGMGRDLTKSEISIIFSHLSAINHAYCSGLEEVIILEDDVILCEDFKERINWLKSNIKEDWEHIYISGHSDYFNIPIMKSNNIFKSGKITGAFSYIVKRSAMQKIIEYCNSLLTTYDDLIMHMISENKLKSYMFLPFLTYIRDYYSENGNDITRNHPSKKYYKNKL